MCRCRGIGLCHHRSVLSSRRLQSRIIWNNTRSQNTICIALLELVLCQIIAYHVNGFGMSAIALATPKISFNSCPAHCTHKDTTLEERPRGWRSRQHHGDLITEFRQFLKPPPEYVPREDGRVEMESWVPVNPRRVQPELGAPGRRSRVVREEEDFDNLRLGGGEEARALYTSRKTSLFLSTRSPEPLPVD